MKSHNNNKKKPFFISFSCFDFVCSSFPLRTKQEKVEIFEAVNEKLNLGN